MRRFAGDRVDADIADSAELVGQRDAHFARHASKQLRVRRLGIDDRLRLLVHHEIDSRDSERIVARRAHEEADTSRENQGRGGRQPASRTKSWHGARENPRLQSLGHVNPQRFVEPGLVFQLMGIKGRARGAVLDVPRGFNAKPPGVCSDRPVEFKTVHDYGV